MILGQQILQHLRMIGELLDRDLGIALSFTLLHSEHTEDGELHPDLLTLLLFLLLRLALDHVGLKLV